MKENEQVNKGSRVKEVKVIIDGTEIELVPRGLEQGFERYTTHKINGIRATVFIKPGWKRSNHDRMAKREEG